MYDLKLKQLQYETESWKRLLEFTMAENVHLKNRISEILKNGFDKNLLDEIENFHSRFVKEDQLIGLLRHEMADVDKLLTREIFEDGKIMKKVETRINKLRNEIITCENQFSKLKQEFNNYLTEYILESTE